MKTTWRPGGETALTHVSPILQFLRCVSANVFSRLLAGKVTSLRLFLLSVLPLVLIFILVGCLVRDVVLFFILHL